MGNITDEQTTIGRWFLFITHFFVYFRSWDLWGGLPANLAGIQNLKEYMAEAIGVKDGEMVVESKGLHLYGYAEELANLRCMR